ncbi:unnamed protein product, partial [Hymenolepis diminuta]
MSTTRLIAYELLTKSPDVKCPPNKTIIQYFERFGIIKNLIILNSNQGLVEFKTVDAANSVISHGQHYIEEREAVVNCISMDPPSKTEPNFQYLRYEICEVNPPNDGFLDLTPELRKAQLKLFNVSLRTGLLGFNTDKEAKAAIKLKIPEFQGWKVTLSIVDEKEYPKFTDIFKVTLGYKMRYVQYEMSGRESVEETSMSEVLWKIFRKEDVVYIHPNTSSLRGIIVLAKKRTAEKYRAKSGSQVDKWR